MNGRTVTKAAMRDLALRGLHLQTDPEVTIDRYRRRVQVRVDGHVVVDCSRRQLLAYAALYCPEQEGLDL